jgi:DNA-binding GntR family transcriptional regulator
MPTMLRPVKRQPALGEQVYHALQGLLRSGDIATGQPLQEVQLAGQLGVSRTPVREAMTRLESEGRLVSDGRSFVIPALTLADVDDIYEIRFLVEPAALRSIATRPIDPGAGAQLDACLQAATAAHAAGDVTRFRDSVGRFRSTWLALVPNPRLVRIVEQYADHMHHMRALTQGDVKMRAIVLAGCRRIAAALVRGNGERAAAASRENLRQAHRAFVAAAGLGQAQTRIRSHSATNPSARTKTTTRTRKAA